MKGRAMSALDASALNASATTFSPARTRVAALSSAQNRTSKHSDWPTASKPAFYAAFYAVVEATGGSIG